MKPINLFVGTDEREQIGLHVFCSSVWRHASVPVSITPISHKALSDGTNAFTLSRFLVPFMCRYNGMAIWADGADMLCMTDIAELAELYDPFKAVQVVKHDYETKHPVKYLGQKNYQYPMKNWSSLMIMNCSHFSWRNIKPESIADMPGSELHRFNFMKPDQIGSLPIEWNWLDEFGPNESAKIIHATLGIPVWKPYSDWWYADMWRKELKTLNSFQEWGGIK